MTEQLLVFPADVPVRPGHIVAIDVPAEQRPRFLPERFGPQFFLRGEMLVYAWMDRLCGSYRGGFWRFVVLSNGGFYMAPNLPGPFPIEVDSNGFSGELSADAAGVVVSLFALNHLVNDGHTQFRDPYYQLLDFASKHEEHRAVLRAID